jgi:hypothetical protein
VGPPPVLSLLAILPAGTLDSPRALPQTTTLAPPQIVEESWTFKDGAPEQPGTFAQTEDGYLWLAATSGLFRTITLDTTTCTARHR